MATFSYSVQAREDLFNIVGYIAQDNPDAALRVNDAVEDTAIYLYENPGVGVSADPAYPDLLMCPVKKYNRYLLFFERRESIVLIQRIFHGAQDRSELLY